MVLICPLLALLLLLDKQLYLIVRFIQVGCQILMNYGNCTAPVMLIVPFRLKKLKVIHKLSTRLKKIGG